MGDQKDKAATRKTYIKKTSISKVLPKKCMSNAIKLRPICTILSHLEREMLFEA